ncbi:MAG: DUF2884 family protein [Idiomarina sp.]|nr:DUF2884 family protein [Idiomarina sp.]
MSTVFATTLVGMSLISGVNVSTSHQCQVSFDYDLHASNDYVAVSHDGQERWRITDNGQLFLAGQPVRVSATQQDLLHQYKMGNERQAGGIVMIMEDASELVSYALTTTFSELFGGRSRVVRRVESLNETLQDEFRSIASYESGIYSIRGSEIDAFGDRLSSTLDSEIEEIITESMGSMFMMIGRALLTGSGSFENRMNQFEQRMETWAESFEQEIELRAERIEQRAEFMCQDFAALAEIEHELIAWQPAFADYALFSKR